MGRMDRDTRKEVRLTLVHDGPSKCSPHKVRVPYRLSAGIPERVSHELGPTLKRSTDRADSGELFAGPSPG